MKTRLPKPGKLNPERSSKDQNVWNCPYCGAENITSDYEGTISCQKCGEFFRVNACVVNLI